MNTAEAMNTAELTLAKVWERGGPLMWGLAGLSVIALAVVLYLLFAQRREALAPRALISDVFSRLQAKDYGETRRLCERRPCAFATLVLAMGILVFVMLSAHFFRNSVFWLLAAARRSL